MRQFWQPVVQRDNLVVIRSHMTWQPFLPVSVSVCLCVCVCVCLCLCLCVCVCQSGADQVSHDMATLLAGVFGLSAHVARVASVLRLQRISVMWGCDVKIQKYRLWLCDVKIQKKQVWRLWYENTKIHVVTLWLCDVKIQKYRAVFNNWPSQFRTHLKQCQSDNQSSCSINF